MDMIPKMEKIGKEDNSYCPFRYADIDSLGNRGRIDLEKSRAETEFRPAFLKNINYFVQSLIGLRCSASVAEEYHGRMAGVSPATRRQQAILYAMHSPSPLSRT